MEIQLIIRTGTSIGERDRDRDRETVDEMVMNAMTLQRRWIAMTMILDMLSEGDDVEGSVMLETAKIKVVGSLINVTKLLQTSTI